LSLGLRAKLIIVSVGVISLSTIVAYLYLNSELAHGLTQRIRQDLTTRAALVAFEAGERASSMESRERWDAFADALGARADARVTIIRADGVVLGDSQVELARLPSVENHGTRREVRGALESGRGVGERASATVGERMLYVAVPFRHAEEVMGVARVAVPLTEVEAASARLRELLSFAFILGLGIAVVLSTVAAQISSRQARELTDVARRMASGDLEARTGTTGTDELAQLGMSLDRLAGGLSATLEDLRDERDRMSGVVAGMQEGLLLLDRDRRVSLVNPALKEMLLLGADVVGKPLLEVIRHADLVRILDSAKDVEPSAMSEIETGGLKPRRLLVRVVRIAGDSGGLLAVFVDVTHLRRLERMRRDFVANASHELRTPIAAIQSAAETLESGAALDPDAAGRFIQMIDRNAKRLRNLVDDMLELSRVESHDFKIRLDALELGDVTDGVLDLFRERGRAADGGLTLSVEPPTLRVRADRKAIEHVLTNLLDNALKYGGPGVRVGLTCREEGEHAVIEVSDTGPGIAAEHIPRLFERFYRVDPGRSRDLGGTGLGLAIVKHLVEAMGGSIAVQSVVGEGTTFRVRLRVPSSTASDAA
jgi:two-component system phosphate regulon sensor histidine kinase PhoR